MYLNRKFHFALFNPLLISIILTIAVLLLMNVSYDSYYRGAQYLSYLLTPATVCLAVPLYEKLETLKKNWKAILAGILSGILSSFGCVLAMSLLFRLSHEEYVTFLPKSITTAIGIGVAEELGGIYFHRRRSHHYHGDCRKHFCRNSAADFPRDRTRSERHRHRQFLSCHRHDKSRGNGRNRRSCQQSVHRRIRIDYRGGGVVFCTDHLTQMPAGDPGK